jgi:hypothetical protein
MPKKKIVKNQIDRKSGPKNQRVFAQNLISGSLNFDQRETNDFPVEASWKKLLFSRQVQHLIFWCAFK